MRIDSPGSSLCDGCKVPTGGASETWSTSPCACALLTASCPCPTDADIVGDGGGCGEPSFKSFDAGELGLGGTGEIWGRFAFDPLDLALVADLVDAASERSLPTEVSMLVIDARGLSDFSLDEPGILDLIDRKEREDSLVSDLLKEGYDCKPSPRRSREVEEASLGVFEPSLDCCWPIAAR